MKFHDVVINKIYFYLWKFKITKLNLHYSNKYQDMTNYDKILTNLDDREYCILDRFEPRKYHEYSNRECRCINYRSVNSYYEFPNFFRLFDFNHPNCLNIDIPKYYWFSSGFNNPNGYNNLTLK